MSIDLLCCVSGLSLNFGLCKLILTKLVCFASGEVLMVVIRMALIEGELASLVVFDAWILFVLVSGGVCFLPYAIEKLSVSFETLMAWFEGELVSLLYILYLAFSLHFILISI